ncbi:sugar transferase [Marinomonas posidonica]|uniref:Exopolysaccharide biosynthesis polyprenyl glycosylphosphotransferase n=1 Tax=Marinomonas posidonica (strain CECT 7376 / NCIMB 14433 / IVIA-Po-181) TaxID=491952 RepID=F6CZP6_MARPP|nr:sugar transferase [Marinomonas posidonica]AEF53557.1 exopolysaccharide biosynthesis polyprenyl glycosylphosphotransferase [Marinomonas posidonica IVIA-Po-181]
MTEKDIPRYKSIRVLWSYRLVDLCIPFLMLSLVHLFFGVQLWNMQYTWLGIMASLFFLVFTQLLGGYSRYVERSIAKKIEIVFKTWAFSVLLLTVIAYLNLTVFSYARSVILTWIFLTPMVLLAMKLFLNSVIRSNLTNVVVLGNGYEFTNFEKARLERQNIRLESLDSINAADLKEQMSSLTADYLLMNLSKTADYKLIQELTNLDLKGVRLITLNHFMETFLRKCYIPYDSTDLAYLERISAYNRLNYFLKRVFDVSAALSLGLITLPVMVYAAIKIRRESPGPIIFSQARVARSGKEHVIYKFRSMHVDAEKDGAQFAQEDDPRAYYFGAFMRKTRIDELPQLWSVLKGDLHFVGPRPERKIFTDKLEEEIPYYNERHLVSPGITGWAQVLYPYGANTEDARQKLMYDLYYIKHWSIWLEIETLIRTVLVVLGRKGL